MPVTGAYTALEWDGLAPDTALAGLPPVLGRRLHIAAGERRSCCGAALTLVAVELNDPALPASVRSSLGELGPGCAVAGTELAELAGGWIAMPGVDIRIGGCADLGAAVVAITLSDAVALLTADGGHRLLVRTTVVLDRRPLAVPAGWRLVVAGADSVAPVPEPVAAHLPGCAA